MEETPLVIASKNGNLNEVSYLIEVAKADVGQQCNFRVDNIQFHGSPLHAAIIGGQLEVVYYLVKCCDLNINAQAKAVVNRDSFGGSTALHLSVMLLCGDVQKNIISCLLEHGADWTIINDMGEQCWELTSNAELAKLFIQFGVGLDSSENAKSFNIAHMWAKRALDNFADEVVALAIEKGVNINEPDIDGLTPLMFAAIGESGLPNLEVFEMIFDQKVQPISRFDRIIALELIGATYISNDLFNNTFLITGFNYLKMAMELRFNVESEPPIPKPPTPLTEEAKIAFKNTYEFENMEELENIAADLHSLRVQAHLIRIRILGLKHSETMRCLISYAIFIWNLKPQLFLNYGKLILKNFDFDSSEISWIDCCSKLFALSEVAITRVSNGMVVDEEISTFKNAMPFLDKYVSLLESESTPCSISFLLYRIVNLVHEMLNDKSLTSQESLELKRCLRRAVRLQKRSTDEGFDLFLLACSDCCVISPSVESECSDGTAQPHSIYYRRPVSAKTISIFIEVGCDLDSVDNNGDTGLHILASNCSPHQCTSSIRMLYEAGVRLDQTNSEGKTMVDVLRERGIEILN